MRKMFKACHLLRIVAATASFVAMGAAVPPEHLQGAASDANAATILKRPAVLAPDTVDFKGDVPIAGRYELEANVGGARPVAGPTDMDQEIDDLVKKIAKSKHKPQAASPKSRTAPAKTKPVRHPAFSPAVPPEGETSAIPTQVDVSAGKGVTQDSALFAKPRWRAERAQKVSPGYFKLPRGN